MQIVEHTQYNKKDIMSRLIIIITLLLLSTCTITLADDNIQAVTRHTNNIIPDKIADDLRSLLDILPAPATIGSIGSTIGVGLLPEDVDEEDEVVDGFSFIGEGFCRSIDWDGNPNDPNQSDFYNAIEYKGIDNLQECAEICMNCFLPGSYNIMASLW